MCYLKNAVKLSLWFALMLGLARCGVRGDPLPPEKPVELGRGRPTYKRATEGIQIERAPRPAEKSDEEKDDTKE